MDHGSLPPTASEPFRRCIHTWWAAGLIFSGPAPDSPEINPRRSGPSCCHAGRSIASILMVFVQSTVCSIGLYQTVFRQARDCADSGALSGRG